MTSEKTTAEPEHVSGQLQKLSTRILQPGNSEAVAARRKEQAAEDTKRKFAANWNGVKLAIGPRYVDCRVSNFKLYRIPAELARQQPVIDGLTAYGESIEKNIKAGRNVVLFGPPGTGKDHLLVGLAYAACSTGHSVRWINGVDLYADVRDSIDSQRNERELLNEFVLPDVLVISDPVPPWGGLTAFQSQFLFRLIDRRYRWRKPIWITANVADSAEASERIGAQAIDRLKDGALTHHCNWESYRKSN